MKEKILKKSTDLFLNLGFKSVTMDDIANELGVSKKTIYSHFKNKTDLVKAVTELLFESIKTGVDCIATSNKNPIEELFEVKKIIMNYLKNQKSSPQYQLDKYYPKIAASLKEKQFEIMHSCILKNLEKGVALHLYRDTIDLEFIARMYFHGITGLKDINLFPLHYFSMNNLMNYFLEYHLRGICTEKGNTILNTMLTNNQL